MTDLKASARSKHASSHRGRTRHGKSAYHSKHLPSEASKQASSSAHKPPLPTNWSRYQDPTVSIDESVDSARSLDEVPAVKSKGADYRQLLSDGFPSAYCEPPELALGTGSMLLARGLDLFGWSLDADSRTVAEDANIDEASVLSVDLASLSRKLGELDLAERLFVDRSLLFIEQEENITNRILQQEIDQSSLDEELVGPSFNTICEASVSVSSDTNINRVFKHGQADECIAPGGKQGGKKLDDIEGIEEEQLSMPLTLDSNQLADAEKVSVPDFGMWKDIEGIEEEQLSMPLTLSSDQLADAEKVSVPDFGMWKDIEGVEEEQLSMPLTLSSNQLADAEKVSVPDFGMWKDLIEAPTEQHPTLQSLPKNCNTGAESHSKSISNTHENLGNKETEATKDEFNSSMSPRLCAEKVSASDFFVQKDTAEAVMEQHAALQTHFRNLELGAGMPMTKADTGEKNGNNVFEAKTAEDELDALLDMLDNPSHNSVGTNQTGTGREVFPDLLEKPANNSKFVSVYSSGSSSSAMKGSSESSNEVLLTFTKSEQVLEMGSSSSPWKPTVETQKLDEIEGLSNLSSDFDEWLDSL